MTSLEEKKINLRRQCTSSLGVGVQLGDDDRADVDSLREGLGLGLAGLADRGIHHEHHVVRLHRVRHLQHFLEQTRFLKEDSS